MVRTPTCFSTNSYVPYLLLVLLNLTVFPSLINSASCSTLTKWSSFISMVILSMIPTIHRFGSSFGLLLRWNRISFRRDCVLEKTDSLKLYDFMYNYKSHLKNSLFLEKKKKVFEKYHKLKNMQS